jgi:predicted dehydrogenase
MAGFGGRGRLIARKLVDLGFDVSGVYDSNPAQLTDAPHRTFTSLEDLLKLDLSALAVATWPSAHAEIATRALERGLDVLVEKPIEVTLERSLEILDAKRRAGRLVAVGYVERLNPAIIKLREVGDLANVVRSREIRIGLSPPTKYRPGVVLDLASHGIDMAYHLFKVEPSVATAHLATEQEYSKTPPRTRDGG